MFAMMDREVQFFQRVSTLYTHIMGGGVVVSGGAMRGFFQRAIVRGLKTRRYNLVNPLIRSALLDENLEALLFLALDEEVMDIHALASEISRCFHMSTQPECNAPAT